MKGLLLLLGLLLTFSGCTTQTNPNVTPIPTTNYDTPGALPTYTPVPLNDPALMELKELLKEAVDKQDRNLLQNTVSFSKWVGAIYRQGGTPPIDPGRGLALTLNFLKENPVTLDILRPTYEPVWNTPAGDTSVLAKITPANGDEPYYAHFYVQREPSAWRFTGIMTRIPYYDAPSVAQLRANPTKYEGKEFMFVGEYRPKTSPSETDGAGPAPDDASFALVTFSGPLWIVQSKESYVKPLPADVRPLQVVRVFGTVKLDNGVPFLLIDSFQTLEPLEWAQSGGEIRSIDTKNLRITTNTIGNTTTEIQLTPTTFISLADGTRVGIEALAPGQQVMATGVPQAIDAAILAEELFVLK